MDLDGEPMADPVGVDEDLDGVPSVLYVLHIETVHSLPCTHTCTVVGVPYMLYFMLFSLLSGLIRFFLNIANVLLYSHTTF